MKLNALINAALNDDFRKVEQSAYRKAKALSKKMGIDVEIERGNGYWIMDNSISGDQWCCSWSEVLEKLQAILAHRLKDALGE